MKKKEKKKICRIVLLFVVARMHGLDYDLLLENNRIACSARLLVSHFGGAPGIGFLEPIRGPTLEQGFKARGGWTTFMHAQQGLARKADRQLEASVSQTCFNLILIIDHKKTAEIKKGHPEHFSLLCFFSVLTNSCFDRSTALSLPSLLQPILPPFVTFPTLHSSLSRHSTLNFTSQCQQLQNNNNQTHNEEAPPPLPTKSSGYRLNSSTSQVHPYLGWQNKEHSFVTKSLLLTSPKQKITATSGSVHKTQNRARTFFLTPSLATSPPNHLDFLFPLFLFPLFLFPSR